MRKKIKKIEYVKPTVELLNVTSAAHAIGQQGGSICTVTVFESGHCLSGLNAGGDCYATGGSAFTHGPLDMKPTGLDGGMIQTQ